MHTTPPPLKEQAIAGFTAAFATWEERYRANRSDFMTAEECERADVAPLSESRAIYFAAILRDLGLSQSVKLSKQEQTAHMVRHLQSLEGSTQEEATAILQRAGILHEGQAPIAHTAAPLYEARLGPRQPYERGPSIQLSVRDSQASKPLQPAGVGSPIGGAGGGHAPIVVQVYALGIGIAMARNGGHLRRAEGAFELEANGVRLVINPLDSCQAHWLVTPVEREVAAIGLPLQAVDEENLSEFGSVDGHGGASLGVANTVILSLPQGAGKTTLALELARRLGCAWVVDKWLPYDRLLGGALHLSQVTVGIVNRAKEGGAQ